MRTKESLDWQSQELQERTWIYMLHNQAPPPTLHAPLPPAPDAHASSGGFIPLAPLASYAPSPLVAARAAAASLALHVNAGVAHTTNLPSGAATWGSQFQSRSQSQLAAASAFSGMVKLEQPSTGCTATLNKKTPLPPVGSASTLPSFVFRSIISKSAVPEAPTPSAHVQRAPGSAQSGSFMAVATKRPRHEQDTNVERRVSEADEEYDYESGEEGALRANGGKRACLPKKCDFPLCKNSSRSRGFCYSHGGGRRCRVDGCANGAVSRDLCKRHGGGRRCRINGCKSSSESGGLCYSHGGGRRCNLSWCNARAKKGGYCAAHVDNRNALPPVDLVQNERGETEQNAGGEATLKIATAKPAASDAVSPQVVETLLLLSKSPSQSEGEDNSDASTTPSGVDLLSPRLSNPYAISSILN